MTLEIFKNGSLVSTVKLIEALPKVLERDVILSNCSWSLVVLVTIKSLRPYFDNHKKVILTYIIQKILSTILELMKKNSKKSGNFQTWKWNYWSNLYSSSGFRAQTYIMSTD